MTETEKVGWDATLSGLNWQAKHGSTGTKLIIAAEDAFQKYGNRVEDLELKLSSTEEKHTKELEQLRKSHAEAIDRRDRNADLLEETISALEAEISKIKTLKVATVVHDEDVTFKFSPRTERRQMYDSSAYFTIDHIEEILMHLRLNGATDDTVVEVNGYGFESVVNTGGTITPMSSESTIEEKRSGSRFDWLWVLCPFAGPALFLAITMIFGG